MARKVEIVKTLRDLTVKEKLMLRGNLDTQKINYLLKKSETFDITTIKDIVILHVHNDEPKDGTDGDYYTVILSDGSDFYSTSSEPVINTLMDLLNEPDIAQIEDFGLHFYKQPSKNNEGDMILCNIF